MHYFSLSPNHFETKSDEDTLKNVDPLDSVATAFARYDFPVPGGPKSRIPLQGFLFPMKNKNHNFIGCIRQL